ncbi:MAG: agmatine deiminase family protein [Desulfohalobiaceae bacterium]
MSPVPAQPHAGLRLPAEWEPHAATWLVWPQNRGDWPGKMAPVAWAHAEIVRKLAASEPVRVLVSNRKVESRARHVLTRTGADLGVVFFEHIPTNRGWARDMFPAFVRTQQGGDPVLVRFRFNGWAKYPDHGLDAEVPPQIAARLELPLYEAVHRGRTVCLEGGALDVNGTGTLLTTEECLLHPTVQVRNPGFRRQDYEALFSHWLGVENVIWLPGGIAGDDTHGHVDDVCRFVSRDTVVLCREHNTSDPNHLTLEANRKVLERSRLEDGSPLQVVELPMPAPLFFDGQRLPASYANFCIANRCVLVPTFNDPMDRVALGILAGLFPGREVVGIHCVDLVLGLGALHCLTHEQPL